MSEVNPVHDEGSEAERFRKFHSVTENAAESVKTAQADPAEAAANPGDLQNSDGLQNGLRAVDALDLVQAAPNGSDVHLDRLTEWLVEVMAQETDRRLFEAIYTAGRSALGMPSTVDTFKAMLNDAGLALVLAPKGGR